MEHLRFHRTTEYSMGERLLQALSLFISMEFLYISFRKMAGSMFDEWNLPTGNRLWQVQVGFFVIILVCNVLTGLAGKYERRLTAGISIGSLILFAQYIGRHSGELVPGLMKKANPYLSAWNVYYRTRYRMPEGDWRMEAYAFGTAVVLLWLTVLLLYYLSKCRLFLLLPSIALFCAGLLVNHLPDWGSLWTLVVGVLLLFTGTIKNKKTTFVADRRGRAHDEFTFFRPLLTYGGVLVLSLLLVLGCTCFFGSLAEQIPEKGKSFMAFQKELEGNVKKLALPRLEVFSKRKNVDNSTPRYTGKKILTISSTDRPDSNMYLCDFTSGTYVNGHWEEDSKGFVRAAEEAGFEASEVRTELMQKPYNNVKNRWGDELVTYWKYRIDYNSRGDSRGLTPYFTDVASNPDIWVDKEGMIKKKPGENTLDFVGLNVNVNTDLLYILSGGLESPSGSMLWYSDYVNETYVKESTLSSIHQMVDNIPRVSESMTLSSTFYGDTVAGNDRASADAANRIRWAYANSVYNYLMNHATYNLYLDQLPPGRDVIDYFLEEGKEGYCMHFASAGTLALQELGIPARYASGYIVKRNSFVGGPDNTYTMEVVDRNAHAWVEIYMENIGWVPFEMTPGYYGDWGELPTDLTNQDELKQRHEEKLSSENTEILPSQIEESQKEEESESEEKTPSGLGSDYNGKSALWPKLWSVLRRVCLFLTIGIGICLLIGKIWKTYQEQLLKELKKKQYRRAVKRINRRIYHRLRRSGNAMSRLTDVDYEKKLIQTYPAISQEHWKEFMRIAKKVAYSREAVSQEEMAFCYHIYQKHRKG